MKIYNRKNQSVESSSQYGGKLLDFLYNHCLGRVLLKFVVHPGFSRLYGLYNDTYLSRRRIIPFAEKYGICLTDYEKTEYVSFNDFFRRKIKNGKRPVNMEASALVAPADSKLTVYPIHKNNSVLIKGVRYTLDELVGGRIDLADFENGKCLIFRLSVDDYHRYIFVDGGRLKRKYGIRGQLQTVSPISKNHKIYRQNSRVINVLETHNFGTIICIEVGAILVGKIRNHPIREFQRGDEKGYFEMGGSTIILLFPEGCIDLDEDILQNCNDETEVKVTMGEKIGSKRVC